MRERSGGLLAVLALLAAGAGACGHGLFVPGRACTPGETRPCYSGAPATEGVGPCTGGEQTCAADASGWGPCAGEVAPQPETCATDADDDCDGSVNEDGEGCACVPGNKQACYEGPDGTEGVGLCVAGERTCSSDGQDGACAGDVTPSDEDCDAPGDEDCDSVACSAPIWAQLAGEPAGGPAADQEARALAVAADGSLFVAFDFAGSIQIGSLTLTSAGATDIAVAKLTPDGMLLWAVAVGAEKDEIAAGLAVGLDGHPVLFATFYSAKLTFDQDLVNDAVGPDAFLVKLGGATGSPIWGRRVGVTGSFLPGAVAVASSSDPDKPGDVIVAGTYNGTLVCTGPSCIGAKIESDTPDAFVQSFMGDGSGVRWTKTAGGPGSDGATAVAVGPGGFVVVGGRVAGDATFGIQNLATTGVSDPNAFVAKLSKDGEVLWAHDFGDTAFQSILGLAVAADGAIAAAGSTQGGLDLGNGASLPPQPAQAFVAKLTSDGSGVWARGYPGQGFTYASAVAFDFAGNVVAAGRFQGQVDFGGKAALTAGGTDAFLLKLDAAGAYRWARGYGAAGQSDHGNAVATMPGGEVLFAGAFRGPVDFGLGTLTPAGEADAGIALFEP